MDPAQYIDPSLGVPAGAPATSLPGSISTTPQQMVNNSQGKILKIILSDSEISKQFTGCQLKPIKPFKPFFDHQTY